MANDNPGDQQPLGTAPTPEQVADIQKVSELFVEFNRKLTDCPLQPIIWFSAGMCASIIDQAFNGDVQAFKNIFDDAIWRQLHLIKIARGETARQPASKIIIPN